jgi:hypothetical protein
MFAIEPSQPVRHKKNQPIIRTTVVEDMANPEPGS